MDEEAGREVGTRWEVAGHTRGNWYCAVGLAQRYRAIALSGQSNKPFLEQHALLSRGGRCQAVVKVIFCLHRQMFWMDLVF